MLSEKEQAETFGKMGKITMTLCSHEEPKQVCLTNYVLFRGQISANFLLGKTESE